VLARLGGDEFGVLLEDCRIDVALDKADRLRRAVQQAAFHWEGIPFSISASIGMVFLGEAGATLAEPAGRGHCLLHGQGKRPQPHSAVQFKDTELAVRSVEMAWVQRLRTAMEEERFCLYFQDIIPCVRKEESGRISKCCCGCGMRPAHHLARCFIPAAERFGLMPDIDRIVVRLTLKPCGICMPRAITPSRSVPSICPVPPCVMTISSTSSAVSLSAMPLRRR
jgi:predicted signal transduction protein with EAL and GGDEF domain